MSGICKMVTAKTDKLVRGRYGAYRSLGALASPTS